jgi:hypothetical protein
MNDVFDYGEYESLMDEYDDLLCNEEDEKDIYEKKVSEINEYWDRENEYIKSSGIYTKEEVEQILDNHNQIRNEKIAEVKKDYEEALDWIREQKQWAAEQRQWEREDRELDRQLASLDADDGDDRAYRAHRDELAAYDDYIASLDMADD